MEHFDLSDQPARPRHQGDPLLRMQAEGAEESLMRVLDDIDEMVAEGQARDLEEGLDPAIEQLLDATAGAAGAPLEFRSLHRRVEDGRLTWLQFWLRPEEEAGGHRLINAAMKAAGAELGQAMADLGDEPPGGQGLRER